MGKVELDLRKPIEKKPLCDVAGSTSAWLRFQSNPWNLVNPRLEDFTSVEQAIDRSRCFVTAQFKSVNIWHQRRPFQQSFTWSQLFFKRGSWWRPSFWLTVCLMCCSSHHRKAEPLKTKTHKDQVRPPSIHPGPTGGVPPTTPRWVFDELLLVYRNYFYRKQHRFLFLPKNDSQH